MVLTVTSSKLDETHLSGSSWVSHTTLSSSRVKSASHYRSASPLAEALHQSHKTPHTNKVAPPTAVQTASNRRSLLLAKESRPPPVIYDATLGGNFLKLGVANNK